MPFTFSITAQLGENKGPYSIRTKKKRRNLLYLHGLESKLGLQKRNILEGHGQVTTPYIDYHHNPETIAGILQVSAL